MSVTIKEIAKIAGVSRGTVDRALHGRDGVKSEVAEQVRSIAQSLDYLPNKAARALSFKKEPKRITAIIPQNESEFFDIILSGIQMAGEELAGLGAEVLPVHADINEPEELLSLIDSIVDEGIDGLVLSGPDTEKIRNRLDHLVEQGIPVITYNSDIGCTKRLCYVGQDLYKSGAVAADLLSKITAPGIIIAVSGFRELKSHTERIKGFTETLKEKGKSYDIRLVEGHDAYNMTLDSLKSSFTELEGKSTNGIKELSRITGVYIATGNVEACLDALETRGLTGKIRIVTNDTIPAVRKGLEQGIIDFTICQDPLNQGYLPVKLLFDYLLNKKEPPAHWVRSPVEIKTFYNLDK